MVVPGILLVCATCTASTPAIVPATATLEVGLKSKNKRKRGSASRAGPSSPASVVARPGTSPVPPASDARQSMDDRLLATHNAERIRLGLPALSWSPQLASNAAKWAAYLAQTGKFEHASLGKDEPDQGENLWMGSRSAYSPEEMVAAWVEERAIFKRGKFPSVSTTGDWRDVGHYTQLVWRRTTHVGCAIAANRENDVLVCRYDPPGNWEGSDPLAP